MKVRNLNILFFSREVKHIGNCLLKWAVWMEGQSGGTISCQHQCAVRGFGIGGAHCIQSDCSFSAWNDHELEEANCLL